MEDFLSQQICIMPNWLGTAMTMNVQLSCVPPFSKSKSRVSFFNFSCLIRMSVPMSLSGKQFLRLKNCMYAHMQAQGLWRLTIKEIEQSVSDKKCKRCNVHYGFFEQIKQNLPEIKLGTCKKHSMCSLKCIKSIQNAITNKWSHINHISNLSQCVRLLQVTI